MDFRSSVLTLRAVYQGADCSRCLVCLGQPFYAMAKRDQDDVDMAWQTGRTEHAEALLSVVQTAADHGDTKVAMWLLESVHGITNKAGSNTTINIDQSDNRQQQLIVAADDNAVTKWLSDKRSSEGR